MEIIELNYNIEAMRYAALRDFWMKAESPPNSRQKVRLSEERGYIISAYDYCEAALLVP